MPVIDPQGLFDGDRLAACSDKAKLYWPFLYCASNGYARLEVNLNQIRRKCFSGFMTPATDSDIIEVLKEYTENFLVILYTHNGKQWVQFDTHKKYLPRHKSKKDEESPPPSEEEVLEFSEGYINWKSAKSLNLQLVRKISENFGKIREKCHGIGVGIGIGVGEGVGVGNTEPTQDNFLEDGQEEDMKAEKAIPVSCMEILGERAETYSDVIEQIKSRARATSNGQVLREFEEWAVENQGDDFRGKPLSAWLRSYTSGRIEQKQATENPMVKAIGREIAYRSGNQMVLEPKHKAALVPIIEEDSYTFEEVLGAYSEFFQKMDKDNPKNIQYAANNFVAQTADLLYSVRRKAQEKAQEAAAVERTALHLQETAEIERRAREAARIKEQELIEEELPD